jgi:hypothetical protein
MYTFLDKTINPFNRPALQCVCSTLPNAAIHVLTMKRNEMEIDPEYEAKMVSFKMDCDGGKGDPAACHFTAEFHATVYQEFNRAAEIFTKNCNEKQYAPSCFSLGRFFCKWQHLDAARKT